MTQGEKITKIDTQLGGLVESVSRIENILSEHVKEEHSYATKIDLKELDEKKAGAWTESWVKAYAIMMSITIVGAILLKFFEK